MRSSAVLSALALGLVTLTLASAQTNQCPLCLNGKCQQSQDGSSYSCVCTSGFSGVYCNITTAPAPAPAAAVSSSSSSNTIVGTSNACQPGCANKGICSLYQNGTSACDCSGTGFSGPTCSVDASANSATRGNSRLCNPTCENGGVCLSQADSSSYYCECSGTSYTGVACTVAATRAPTATAVAPAAQTSTENTVAGSKAPVPSSLSAGAVVGIIAIVLAAFLVMGAGIILWRRRSAGSSFQKFDERPSMEIQAPYSR